MNNNSGIDDSSVEKTLDSLLKPENQQSDLFKFAREMYDDIRTKTDIPDKNDMLMRIIKVIYYAKECERFEVTDNIPKLSELIHLVILENYYKLSISSKRKGRLEAFTFLNGTRSTESKDEGFFKRLLGR